METKQPGNQITLHNISVLSSDNFLSITDKMARDMKFYAVCYIIYGGFICLSIIGALLGVPIIIYNLKLKNAADQYRKFARDRDFFRLNKAFEYQQKFFFFNKVLIIISLGFLVLYILFIIFFGISMFIPPSSDFV